MRRQRHITHHSGRLHRRGAPFRLAHLFLAEVRLTIALVLALLWAIVPGRCAEYERSQVTPPVVLREFRGAWVATVKNIDWPSKPGLSTAQQKREMIEILDCVAHLHLNAIVLQVRPGCDALYASRLEPWSEYITGRMGQAPKPYYDPLAFAIEEAHRRGLELHAWFNPYRARHGEALSPVSKNHVSKAQPKLVKTYGQSQWLDPGDKAVQEYSYNVVMDVVDRYDIDAVHFDDYFYPYDEKDGRGQPLPFPDWASWGHYKEWGGKMAKEDWRRDNVNSFLRRVGQGIRARKPWVRFGISPFGIWRPGSPPGVRGLDSYAKLYSDSRRWLMEGWVDYLAPQLYWSSSAPEQSFPSLLKWWTEQNPTRHQVWAGLAHRHPAEEIVRQIRLTRTQTGASGQLHWSVKALLQNRGNVNDLLLKEVYAEPALIPASPWLDPSPPPAPILEVTGISGSALHLRWSAGKGERIGRWLLQTRSAGVWTNEVLAGTETSHIVPAKSDVMSLIALDRVNNASAPTVLQRKIAGAVASP